LGNCDSRLDELDSCYIVCNLAALSALNAQNI